MPLYTRVALLPHTRPSRSPRLSSATAHPCHYPKLHSTESGTTAPHLAPSPPTFFPLQGDNISSAEFSYGGHAMLSTPKYISAKGAMQLQNVEVRQMGQAYQLGRWVTGQAY